MEKDAESKNKENHVSPVPTAAQNTNSNFFVYLRISSLFNANIQDFYTLVFLPSPPRPLRVVCLFAVTFPPIDGLPNTQ